jgi:hypothetical protein
MNNKRGEPTEAEYLEFLKWLEENRDKYATEEELNLAIRQFGYELGWRNAQRHLQRN